MIDIIFEVLRAAVAFLIVACLWQSTTTGEVRKQEGWSHIVCGFSLVLFGMLIDITDNFPVLNKFVFIGDTPYQAFLEKVVGGLLGFTLIAIGFWKWVPTINSVVRIRCELGDLNNELEIKVEARTVELLLFNEKLTKEISEHKRAQAQIKQSREQLRELANQLQMVREEERTKISREIHDHLGQTLSFLKMDMAWMLEHLSPEQKDLQDRARSNLTMMDETLQAVRRISQELRPAMLDELGLEAAIEHQVEEFNQRTGADCLCELEFNAKDIGLDNKRDTVVFRVLQESLTNVVRHAQAEYVKVTLSTLDSKLALIVEDNGVGIDKEKKRRLSDSIGIIGMRERCEAIGGTFQIAAIDAGGTRVICSVPLSSTA